MSVDGSGIKNTKCTYVCGPYLCIPCTQINEIYMRVYCMFEFVFTH